MKKFIALLLTLVMCFALAATASAESPAEPEYTEITMKLSHHNAVDQPIGVALDAWAKMVNEKTGGKVTIDVYPAASLYSSGDAQDSIIMGTLDMCLGDTSLLSSDEPEYALFSLPFMFDSYDTAAEIVFGDIGKEIDKRMEENLGVKPLGWTWNNFRNMCTKDPITSIADCKGYKLRSPGADIYMDTFNTLGMSPNPISWSEAYTAMQSGVVDGVESGLEAFYTQGFYELGNNICLSRHMISIIGPCINVDKWNSLNEATQKVLREKAVEACNWGRDVVEAEHETLIQEFRDKGIQVDVLTEEQIAPFKEAVAGVKADFLAKFDADALAAFGIEG